MSFHLCMCVFVVFKFTSALLLLLSLAVVVIAACIYLYASRMRTRARALHSVSFLLFSVLFSVYQLCTISRRDTHKTEEATNVNDTLSFAYFFFSFSGNFSLVLVCVCYQAIARLWKLEVKKKITKRIKIKWSLVCM